MPTLQTLQNQFQTQISSLYSENEAQLLFQYFAEEYLGLKAIELRLQKDSEISDENLKKFDLAISQLLTGKPYQQIIGKAYFYGEEFFVNEHTLIPRPETEELIELALQTLKDKTNLTILDIGTGSGCIGITLAKHLPTAKVTLLDYSEEALEVAKKNATFHQINIEILHQDYLNTNLQNSYDVIISNPPYIGTEENPEIEESVKDFEPMMALFAPENDVLAFYRKIANDIPKHLKENGYLFLEINQKLGSETLKLYIDVLSESDLIKDISDNDRMIMGKK